MNKYASIILTVVFIAMAALLILFDQGIIKEADPSQTSKKPVNLPSPESTAARTVTFVDPYTSGLKFELNFNRDGYVVTGINGNRSQIIMVPPTYSGLPVTEIGDYAFNLNSTIKYVKLPETVTKINDYAFFGCTSLVEVVHNNSITYVGNGAFCESAITELTVGSDSKELFIGIGAFSDCKMLEKIVLKGNMQTLSRNAFLSCTALHDVTLPDSLETIGTAAFKECHLLNKINIPKSLKVIESEAFSECQNISAISLPDTTTDVGNFAFRGCLSLTDFRFSASMSKISTGMFSGCISLTIIGIPDNIKEIGAEAFRNTPLSRIILPKELTELSPGIFYSCEKLKELNIPTSVTAIASLAFYGCEDLESIFIPKNVSSIADTAFSGCTSLKSITVSEQNEHFHVEGGSLVSKKDGQIIFTPQKDNKP